MLRIWGRMSSINVQKVTWCAEEAGIPYERIDAGREFGIVNTPEFLALNPNGLVPVIEDDGFVLWESNAIVRYLSAKYGAEGLYPADIASRADADRWLDWSMFSLATAMHDAFWQLVRTEAPLRDRDRIAEAVAKTEKAAAILDAHLEGKHYVAGKTFTIGDIGVGCVAHRWLGLPVQKERRRFLERYVDDLRDRKSAARILTLPIV